MSLWGTWNGPASPSAARAVTVCSPVTCTPYGVNTQRLLVRGHRIKNIQQSNVTSDALQIEPLIVAPIVATPLLLLLLVLLFLSKRQDPSDGGKEDETV